jgi:UDP-glucose 4-epimerase
MMTRLVIVTGARGAIGRHVVHEHVQRGDRVLGLGQGPHEVDLPTVDWINGAIDAANLSNLTAKWGKPDAIVHLAGGAAVGPSLVSPAEDFERTTSTSVRLLEWTRNAAPDAALVLASSAAVYGSGHPSAISELDARNPISPYGVHKAMMEMATESWARNFGVRVAVVRLFSVYGDHLRKQLIWEQTRKILDGERQLVLGGTGLETRDWVYIGDAARMLVEAIDLADTSAPTLNGCSGVATTIKDTIGLLAAVLDTAVDVRFSGEERPGDPKHLVGNPTRARFAGLETRVILEKGLRKTVRWISQKHGHRKFESAEL